MGNKSGDTISLAVHLTYPGSANRKQIHLATRISPAAAGLS